MGLAAGTRLGTYQVLGSLGAGGMGVVYRAHDTRLDRDVALKILPDALASDPDRLARFEREAKTLAALNHPNIAHVYGFEHAPAGAAGQAPTHALVMELVEGEDLSQRIARGPLPLDDALAIARQIADALEASHEQGIVHRDLKPANIKVRDDGTVKVLDFGLAKALEPGVGSRESGVGNTLANSPTITSPAMLTGAGVLLGTAAYMSPEQARGKSIDRRTDIWAFGCVLYEMLTGKRAFAGEDVSDTLAAVLRGEPDWSRLSRDIPPGLRIVVQRCLEKDAKKRLRDIGDVQLALGGAFDIVSRVETETRAGFRPRSLVVAAVAGAACAALLTSGWWRPRPEPLPPQPVRFSIAPPADYPLNPFLRSLAISPDGSRIAYVTGRLNAPGQVMIRPLDRLDASPLRGSESGLFPFFSPDGHSIAFFAQGEIRRVSLAGGARSTICRYSAAPRGAAWGPDGTIVFATNDVTTGLFSVPADGGEPKMLTTPDPTSGEQDHVLPALSPDGRVVFFTVASEDGVDSAQIAALDLKTGQRRTVVRGGSDATYIDISRVEPARARGLLSALSVSRTVRNGLLVYASAGTLTAARFDLEGLNLLGDPIPVVEQVVMMQTGVTQYGLSPQGTLVYVSGPSAHLVPRSLEWITRDGRRDAIDAPPGPYTTARLSPDEKRVALAMADQGNDIWIYDLARRTMTNLTANPGVDLNPIWSPDGQRIVFASNRSGSLQLHSQRADGTGPVVPLTTGAATSAGRIPNSFSPDGRALVFREFAGDAIDLMLVRFDPEPRVEPLLQTPAVEMNGEVSPDGRWIAYESSGQVFVRPFPNVEGARYQISIEAGSKPAWSGRGNELFYLDPRTTAIMAVSVETTGRFNAGTPVKLFAGPWYAAPSGRVYDVSRDGQRFLMIRDAATSSASAAVSPTLTVALNWTEELRAKLSAGR